eukprot:TRINITY_DN6738_c0_g1_i1.p1 TRINITY_DN6738_c0_g1~~TRINITY_DN6738_c0_g1_i1.p1  ORF type:complete len:730 (+),score=151.44 TRINITY_DN6738_c0_g1_i1:121-2190(+)
MDEKEKEKEKENENEKENEKEKEKETEKDNEMVKETCDVAIEDDDEEDSDVEIEVLEEEDFENDEEKEDSGEESDLEGEESYHGSDYDMDQLEGADDDSDIDSGESGGGIDLSQGLLASVFSGGSLHAEEKRMPRDMMLGSQAKPKPSIRVVFPSLIWRGKDMMVLNKPADWICSASDVDKKRGRPLDPNEKVGAKGFKILQDLQSYSFGDREKKYIHWWIQLMHDLDAETYPNLFDEDQNYGLCHRLDRETSGTVLVGLTQLARLQMRECFHRHYVRKMYVCLAHGIVAEQEQTIDRNLEAMGQKARLHPGGKRARTHVKVLGNYTRKTRSGKIEEYSLCSCEIAEGRMHQIRLHMSGAIGAPIVSEFYYQKTKQMIEDRRWCQRTFLHAYAVGFPDVSGSSRRVGVNSDSTGLVEDERRDTEQEWHCCICPLTIELREALGGLTPKDEKAAQLRKCIVETGLMDTNHEAVHCMGTTSRKNEIDDLFFPWSSVVNPIEVGDINKPREAEFSQQWKGSRRNGDASKGRGRGGGDDNPAALRPKAKPRRRNNLDGPRPTRGGPVASHRELRKRLRVGDRGRPRSPGPQPTRSRSPVCNTPPGPPPPPRQGRRGRSRSRTGVGGGGRRRVPGAPPSPPRHSPSVHSRRKRRRFPSPRSVSPPLPPPPHRPGSGGARVPAGNTQRVVLTACR